MFLWYQRGGNTGVWIVLPGFPIRWALGGVLEPWRTLIQVGVERRRFLGE